MTTQVSKVTAIAASKFTNSIGVNTHLGNWTLYENVGLVESSLAYLGVTTIRDGAMFSTLHAQAAYSELASDGIRFDLVIPTGSNLATFVSGLDAFVKAHPGSLFAIEGPNEIDLYPFSYNGSASLKAAAKFQHALFAAVQADPLLKDVAVYNLTLSQSIAANYAQLGNLSTAADYANIHAYAWSGTTPNNVLLDDIKIARWDAAGLPVIFTETGYNTMTSDPMSGVSQAVQAKYTLDILMDAYNNGVQQTFLYELFDEVADPKFTNKEAHFGLFNNDGTPKLAATAVHNLTTILADPNAPQSFIPGSLAYSVDNMPSSASKMLLEKHDGTFDLVLWNEQVIWDPIRHKEIASSTSNVTVNLGKTYASVYVFDPLVGTKPIATYTNVQQIQVGLTDHPLIIQIGNPILVKAPVIASFSPDSNVVGDGITNAHHITLAGTGVANSTIKVFDGVTLIGTAKAGASGAWSFATASLSDGNHSFTAIDVDAAGNVSAASGVRNVKVDSVAPIAPVIISDASAPKNALIVSGKAEAGSTVKLFEGSALLGKVAADVGGIWKITTGSLTPGAHDLTATATDAAGNVSQLSNVLGPLVGATVIEDSGSAKLFELGHNFYVGHDTVGYDAKLKFFGATQVVDPSGRVAPIGAEKTTTGYKVVWELGADQYSIWSTDNSGNALSFVHVSGSSATLKALEAAFQQDLNGDGVIARPKTVIESFGSAGVVESGNSFHVSDGSSGLISKLSFAGVDQLVDPSGRVAPIGAEKTSTGYQVVWKLGSDQYSIWNTDGSGREVSFVHVAGSSSTLKALEVSFGQDLNGDGVINTPSTVLDISGKMTLALSKMTQSAVIGPGATLELGGAASGSITFKDATGTLVLDHSSQFTGKIFGLSGNGDPAKSDILDLRDISFGAGTTASYSGNSAGGVLTVTDAQKHAAHLTLVGNYTNSKFNLSGDGHGGTLVIDPPEDQFKFDTQPAAPNSASPAWTAAVKAGAFDFVQAAGENPSGALDGTGPTFDAGHIFAFAAASLAALNGAAGHEAAPEKAETSTTFHHDHGLLLL